MLTLRLQRTGRKKLAHYRLIAQEHSLSPTSGRVAEFLGTFNPYTKEFTFDKEKVEKHLSNGAQPSNKVAKLLQANGQKLPSWVTITTKPERKKEEPKKEEAKTPDNTPGEEESVEEAAEAETEASDAKTDDTEAASSKEEEAISEEATAEEVKPEDESEASTEAVASEESDEESSDEAPADETKEKFGILGPAVDLNIRVPEKIRINV